MGHYLYIADFVSDRNQSRGEIVQSRMRDVLVLSVKFPTSPVGTYPGKK